VLEISDEDFETAKTLIDHYPLFPPWADRYTTCASSMRLENGTIVPFLMVERLAKSFELSMDAKV